MHGHALAIMPALVYTIMAMLILLLSLLVIHGFNIIEKQELWTVIHRRNWRQDKLCKSYFINNSKNPRNPHTSVLTNNSLSNHSQILFPKFYNAVDDIFPQYLSYMYNIFLMKGILQSEWGW